MFCNSGREVISKVEVPLKFRRFSVKTVLSVYLQVHKSVYLPPGYCSYHQCQAVLLALVQFLHFFWLSYWLTHSSLYTLLLTYTDGENTDSYIIYRHTGF